MINFNCDMCGKPLLVDEDVRYVVKLEVFAAYDPMELVDEDLDKDHLEEMSHLIDKMEDMNEQDLEDQVYKNFRFDLCPTCRKNYVKDPLFKEARRRIRFGDN
jgi:hypothetical protein